MFTKKDLQRLIFPLVIEQILVMLVGIADTVMVSYAGEAAISGVSLVDMINYLFITVFAAIATGGAVVVAQYLGSGEPAAASRSASQLYMLAGAISLVCAAMCLAFHRGILAVLFGAIEPGVMEAAVLYFVITSLSFPFLGVYNAGAALFGTTQIAANGVANSIDMIAIVVVSAINLAMVTVVGQCVGANDYEQAKRYTRTLMRVSYLATAALSAAVAVCLPLLRRSYDVSDETWALSCVLILLHNALATLLHPTSFNLSNTLRAAGDVRYTIVVGIASMVVFRLGSAVLFGIVLGMGVIGVWSAMGMDWLARSVAFVLRYKSGRWKRFRAI